MSTTRDLIAIRLKINRMIHGTTNTHVLQKSMEAIINLFGGIPLMIQFITANTNINEMRAIHDITKQIKQDVEFQIDSKYTCTDHDTQVYASDDHFEDNLFEFLPNECIHHILGYLDRNSIASFKLCSRQIAICCLQELERITVSVLPYTVLLDDNTSLYRINWKHKTYATRHVATKRYHTLFEEWSKFYKIPERNQLICSQGSLSSHWKYYTSFTPQNTVHIRATKMRKKSYLLMDNRNIVVLNEKEARLYDVNVDTMECIQLEYKLLILEYYDIMKRSLQIVQFILFKNGLSKKRLCWYLEHGFIAMDGIDNEWYYELSHCLTQMCVDRIVDKLCLYTHSTSSMEKYDRNDLLCSFVTFQLNHIHPWFAKTDRFNKQMTEYTSNMEQFEFEADQFCKNNIMLNIEIKNDAKRLESCVERYYDLRLSKQEQQIYKCDIQRLFKMIKKRTISIQINISLTIGILKRKISKLFDHIFEPKYIDLSQNYIALGNNETIRCSSMSCDFVLYETGLDLYSCMSGLNSIYTVYIYDHSQSPLVYYKPHDATLRMQIEYHSYFRFNDFVHCVFDTIYKATDHVLYPQYKYLIDLFYGEQNEDTDDDDDMELEPVMTTRIMSTCIECFCTTHNGSDGDIYALCDPNQNIFGSSELDIYMMRTKAVNTKYDHTLMIKFVLFRSARHCPYYMYGSKALHTRTKIGALNELKYVGLPFIIWIKHSDSLQDIIDRYLGEFKLNHIESCWRVNVGVKFMKLQPKTWKCYQPYYEFMWESPDDFIIFQIRGHYKRERSYDMNKIMAILDGTYKRPKTTAYEIAKLYDETKDENEANKLMIGYLMECDYIGSYLYHMHWSTLTTPDTLSLTQTQKWELKWVLSRGIKCLNSELFAPLFAIFEPYNDDEEFEIDMDRVDDSVKVQAYNYMLAAISKQETNKLLDLKVPTIYI